MTSKAIQGFDWDKAFSDKSTEEKASIQSIRYFEQTLFEQVLKFLSKSIISNFLENLESIKSILNVTGPY